MVSRGVAGPAAVIIGQGAPIALTGCGPSTVKIGVGRNATLVRAKWPRCGDSLGVRLSAKIRAPACDRLQGTLRARKTRRAFFTAIRSPCGNGSLDRTAEACDASAPNGDAACPGACAPPGASGECSCIGTRAAVPCPANSVGADQPSELRLRVVGKGSDLDNGWTGAMYDLPIPDGTTVQLCLDGCDSTEKPECATTLLTGRNAFNGTTFGPPLPAFVARLPICVVSRYASQQERGTANLRTGEVNGPVHLLADVFLTDEVHVCPRCETGTCDSGENAGQPCYVDGEVDVPEAQASNQHFKLSKDCPPPADLQTGTLTIDLSLTTRTSVLAPLPGGSPATPCVAQPGEYQGLSPRVDNCGMGTCAAPCTGDACVSTGQDYSSGTGVCVDSKGGLGQLCCSGHTNTPCLPGDPDSGGSISRVGRAEVPQPAWPDPTYPKRTTCAPGRCTVPVATFCEPATGTSSLDSLTGLPGPGALILPVTTTWMTP